MQEAELWIIEIFNVVGPLLTLKVDYSDEENLGIACIYLCGLAETEAAPQETLCSERMERHYQLTETYNACLQYSWLKASDGLVAFPSTSYSHQQ